MEKKLKSKSEGVIVETFKGDAAPSEGDRNLLARRSQCKDNSSRNYSGLEGMRVMKLKCEAQARIG